MLHFVKTTVYYDSPKMDDPVTYLKSENKTPYSRLLYELSKNFTNLDFVPSTKGFFIERLRNKLINLSKRNSNEIVKGNISEIINKF